MASLCGENLYQNMAFPGYIFSDKNFSNHLDSFGYGYCINKDISYNCNKNKVNNTSFGLPSTDQFYQSPSLSSSLTNENPLTQSNPFIDSKEVIPTDNYTNSASFTTFNDELKFESWEWIDSNPVSSGPSFFFHHGRQSPFAPLSSFCQSTSWTNMNTATNNIDALVDSRARIHPLSDQNSFHHKGDIVLNESACSYKRFVKPIYGTTYESSNSCIENICGSSSDEFMTPESFYNKEIAISSTDPLGKNDYKEARIPFGDSGSFDCENSKGSPFNAFNGRFITTETNPLSLSYQKKITPRQLTPISMISRTPPEPLDTANIASLSPPFFVNKLPITSYRERNENPLLNTRRTVWSSCSEDLSPSSSLEPSDDLVFADRISRESQLLLHNDFSCHSNSNSLTPFSSLVNIRSEPTKEILKYSSMLNGSSILNDSRPCNKTLTEIPSYGFDVKEPGLNSSYLDLVLQNGVTNRDDSFSKCGLPENLANEMDGVKYPIDTFQPLNECRKVPISTGGQILSSFPSPSDTSNAWMPSKISTPSSSNGSPLPSPPRKEFLPSTCSSSSLFTTGYCNKNESLKTFDCNDFAHSILHSAIRSPFIELLDDTKPTVLSIFLEEYRTNKNFPYRVDEVMDFIVELSCDQYGSRFLQQLIQCANLGDREKIFRKLYPQILDLITDVFGNYVVQKYFEVGSSDQKINIAEKMRGRLFSLSLHMYGCRVIQKAFEYLDYGYQSLFMEELKDQLLHCIKDQNGNHVIQKCIERLSPDLLNQLLKSFEGHMYGLASHPYGCRVIQRIFEHCTTEKSQMLIDELHRYTLSLVQDQYGNYVIQHILEKGTVNDKKLIISKMKGHIFNLSRHKFASNVIEKCVAYGSEFDRQDFIEEIIHRRSDGVLPLVAMVKDPFANYVLQKMLDIVSRQQQDLLIAIIRPLMGSFRKFTYGKHIILKIDKIVNGQTNSRFSVGSSCNSLCGTGLHNHFYDLDKLFVSTSHDDGGSNFNEIFCNLPSKDP